MATAMIYAPRQAVRKGEVVTLKAIVSHPMETGYRRTETGEPIPRDIIRHVACRYDGEEIFACELYPAISANPFVSFTTVATRSGPITFTWRGDNGFQHVETVTLTVAD